MTTKQLRYSFYNDQVNKCNKKGVEEEALAQDLEKHYNCYNTLISKLY